MRKIKALLHIDEADKWKLMLLNIKNLLADVGQDKVSVEIVVNGPAVKIFAEPESIAMDQDQGERKELLQNMALLENKNVVFSVCRNSLRANFIHEESLPDFLTVVPAGITRILLQQEAGYFYVKP